MSKSLCLNILIAHTTEVWLSFLKQWDPNSLSDDTSLYGNTRTDQSDGTSERILTREAKVSQPLHSYPLDTDSWPNLLQVHPFQFLVHMCMFVITYNNICIVYITSYVVYITTCLYCVQHLYISCRDVVQQKFLYKFCCFHEVSFWELVL